MSDPGPPDRPHDPDEPLPEEPLIVPMSDEPAGLGSEPTRIMPETPPPPPPPGATEAMPVIDAPIAQTGGVPVTPVPPPRRWYEDPGPRAAAIAVGLALLFLLIAGLIWWANDDPDDNIAIDTSSSTTVPTSTGPSTSIVSSTLPITAAPSSSSTSTSTTTTTTTTTTTSTTEPPTTTEATTTEAPTTTAPPTTSPPPTTTVPPTTTLPPPVVTPPPSADATLLDLINATPDLSGVRELIEFSGSQAEFETADPRTFLAPRNEAVQAFAATPQGAAVLQNPNAVRQLLLDHMAADAMTAAELFAQARFESLSNRVFLIDGAAQTIDGARIVVADVEVSNGVLHVLSDVLGT